MNIEFGCGANPTRKDYRTCDVRALPGIDYVCPAWNIDQLVDAGTVDVIFSRHFFEHLTFPQGKLVLSVWHKILSDTGTVEMMIPDMDYHIWQWQNNKNMDHARAGFWGWQRQVDDGEIWDIHKSGYNFDTMQELVAEMGYRNCVRIKAPRKHLYVRFEK